jgi:hypothetical protein
VQAERLTWEDRSDLLLEAWMLSPSLVILTLAAVDREQGSS